MAIIGSYKKRFIKQILLFFLGKKLISITKNVFASFISYYTYNIVSINHFDYFLYYFYSCQG